MSVTDYVIDLLLILVIFRQVAPRELTLPVAVLPIVLLAVAGAVYLRPTYHSGGAAVARFSVEHDITGAQIWTTAFVIMAFGQVLARLGALQFRRLLANREPVAAVQRGMTARV